MRKCRICGCTDLDCRQCINKTGEPCYWVEEDLCSACAEDAQLRNSNAFDYIQLQLRIICNGAVINEVSKSGKTVYFITANFNRVEESILPDYFKNYALKWFPTEKGARRWCKRKNIKVIRKKFLVTECLSK